MKCNSIIDFTKIQNTGSNMTIGFNKGFVNYLKSSIGLTESNSTFFAASDSTNEIVGVDSNYNNSTAALAVWGIDSSEKDVNRDFIGLLDDESFSIFVMVDLNIYQINQTLSYSQNGIVIFDENNRVSEVCYTEPTQDNYDKLVEASEGLSEELILAQDSIERRPPDLPTFPSKPITSTPTTPIDDPIIVEDGVDESGFYESGFSDGVASVDITSDNEAVFSAGYSEGVASVDITSDNQIAYAQGYEDGVASDEEVSNIWYDLYMEDLPKINAYDRLKQEIEEVREAYLNSVSKEDHVEALNEKNAEIIELKEDLREKILSLGSSEAVNNTLIQSAEADKVKIGELNADIQSLKQEILDEVALKNEEIADLKEQLRENILSAGLSEANANNLMQTVESLELEIASIIPEDGITQEDLDVLQLKISALESYQAQMVDSNHSLIAELDTKKKIVGFSLVALLFILISKK